MPHETPPQPSNPEKKEENILISKMNAEQLNALREKDPSYIKTPDFAIQLTWKQLDELDSLQGEKRWSKEEFDTIKLNKGLRRRKHFSEIDPKAYSRLERMPLDDLLNMQLSTPEWFSNPSFVSALKWWQVDAILKDDRWSWDRKQEIRRLKDVAFDDASRASVGLAWGQEDEEEDPKKRAAIQKEIDDLKDRLTWVNKDERIPRKWAERKSRGNDPMEWYEKGSIQYEYILYLLKKGKKNPEIEIEMDKAEYLHKQGEIMMWEVAKGRSNSELTKSRGMYWRNPWVFRIFNGQVMRNLREKDRGELMPLIKTILGWYYECPDTINRSCVTDPNIDAIHYLVTDREGKQIYSPEPGDWPLPDEDEIRELKKRREKLTREKMKAQSQVMRERLGIN